MFFSRTATGSYAPEQGRRSMRAGRPLKQTNKQARKQANNQPNRTRTESNGNGSLEDRVTYWVFIKGGCSRRGVQWIGAVLHNK